jgi:putative membrane protein
MKSLKIIRNLALTMGVAGLCSVGAMAQYGQTGATTNAAGGDGSTTAGTVHTSASGNISAADRAFVRKAAQGGLAEVQLGQLATEKASSPEVKQFGQRMVDDHSKANDELKQLAQQKGITVPDKLDAKDAATKARLEKLSGKQFDRAYMKDMVMDHTKDVTEFKHESRMAKDPQVKEFASQTTPTLEDHLKEAKSIAPKVGAEQASSKSSTTGGGTQ